MKNNIDVIEVIISSSYESLQATIDLVTSEEHIREFGALSDYDLDILIARRDDLTNWWDCEIQSKLTGK